MTTNPRAIERALEQTGWTLHTETLTLGKPSYRAEQGPFVTPCRASADMVLCDVRRLSEPDPHGGRNEDDARLSDR